MLVLPPDSSEVVRLTMIHQHLHTGDRDKCCLLCVALCAHTLKGTCPCILSFDLDSTSSENVIS